MGFGVADNSDGSPIGAAFYARLHDVASAIMRRERRDHTLQATALIHEAMLRFDDIRKNPEDERRALACAARVMRQVLVDHARRRGAAKRGGDHRRVALDTRAMDVEAPSTDVLELDEAIERLKVEDPRKAAVVELKFFGEMTHAQIAAELGVSEKTIEADWYFARAWLRRALERGEGS
jgi:RNA polymerase sigma factor (TIGR02999 family)